MQLDTTIEQRRREIGNVSNDINGERDTNENYKNNMKRAQLEVLSMKLQQAQTRFEANKLNSLSKRYDEVATNRFTNQF